VRVATTQLLRPIRHTSPTWLEGVGVDRDNDFDAFAPTSPTSLELIVDDLDNIDFVNWT